MTVRVGLAGDTMLGRGVAEALRDRGPRGIFAPEVVELARSADLLVVNLECCISERGRPWPDPGKPFFFRAPPAAVEVLVDLGVDAVTLANNHALDYGRAALEDTLDLLAESGIAVVGAGRDAAESREPAVLRAGGREVAVVGLTDHPEDYAAGPERPGVAFADLRSGEIPAWVRGVLERLRAPIRLVTPHWGPNMTRAPVPWVEGAGRALVDAGATLVAGHSAHVFHGAAGRILWDLGDLVDDYAIDAGLRNDLGLLWIVSFDGEDPVRLEAFPLHLGYCFTRLAEGAGARWIRNRFRAACDAMGATARDEGDRLVVEPLGSAA